MTKDREADIMFRDHTFFVVEDYRPNREDLCHFIVSRQGNVIQAESVSTASEIIDRGVRFDLMILDLNLSDGYGFTILDKIQRERRVAKVYIISGYIESHIFADVARYGVAGYAHRSITVSRDGFSTFERIADELLACARHGRYVCAEHNLKEVNVVEAKARDALLTAKSYTKFFLSKENDSDTLRKIKSLDDQLAHVIAASKDATKSDFSWQFLKSALRHNALSIFDKARDETVKKFIGLFW